MSAVGAAPAIAYGAGTPAGEGASRVLVRTAGLVLDGRSLAESGAIPDADGLLAGPNLDALLAADRAAWRRVDAAIARAVGQRSPASARTPDALRPHVVDTDALDLALPFTVGDFVDFYSSIEHATNLGRLLRPTGDPLLPNWRHLPVGYHGRSGSVVVSGTAVRRPSGQRVETGATAPVFGPSTMLDFELEVGFVTGRANEIGRPVPVGEAEEHIFGLVLVNDWSARDIQAWEYQPLGPFLGKSFATSISGWVLRLDSLAPYRVAGPVQDPEPLDYLRGAVNGNVDLSLEVTLQSKEMRRRGLPAVVISTTSTRGLYWTMAQQLAHASANGAPVRAGDLFASGTVSGATPGTEGSLIELSWRGARPLELPSGERRSFLEDGDEVAMRGWCGEGPRRIDLGEVRGEVLAAT